MRFPSIVLVAAAVLAGAGCRDQNRSSQKTPEFGEVLPNVPLPPGASFVSKSGGNEAVLVVFRSPNDLDQVADYYRGVLTQGKWRLLSDTRDAIEGVKLYAEQDGPPLWVTISRDGQTGGSRVSLAGARPDPVDSAKRAATPSPAGSARRPIP
jgi:hypothetical protein